MKAYGTDGKEYKLKLVGKVTKFNDHRKRSAGHVEARNILLRNFPYDQLHEEITIPGCKYTLYLDFLIPQRRLAVEVQGIQHRKFVVHFHGNIKNFLTQRKRDAEKKEWCELNNITLVELDDDDRTNWESKILGRAAE